MMGGSIQIEEMPNGCYIIGKKRRTYILVGSKKDAYALVASLFRMIDSIEDKTGILS